MDENESSEVSWKQVLACLVAAGFLLNGVMKSWNKPNASAWEEVFKTLMYLGGQFIVFLVIVVVGFTIYFVTKAVLDKLEAAYLMWETNRKWRDDRELDLKESNRLKEKIISQNSEIINRVAWVEINQKAHEKEIKELKEQPQAVSQMTMNQIASDLLGNRD